MAQRKMLLVLGFLFLDCTLFLTNTKALLYNQRRHCKHLCGHEFEHLRVQYSPLCVGAAAVIFVGNEENCVESGQAVRCHRGRRGRVRSRRDPPRVLQPAVGATHGTRPTELPATRGDCGMLTVLVVAHLC